MSLVKQVDGEAGLSSVGEGGGGGGGPVWIMALKHHSLMFGAEWKLID